jgi:hypothetical protein
MRFCRQELILLSSAMRRITMGRPNCGTFIMGSATALSLVALSACKENAPSSAEERLAAEAKKRGAPSRRRSWMGLGRGVDAPLGSDGEPQSGQSD